MQYVRVVDEVAVDVSADPAKEFHVSLAAEFEAVPVSDDVSPGWRRQAGVWMPPEVVHVVSPAPAADARLISPIDFMLRLPATTRVAIRASTDPVVQDWLRLLDDPRLLALDMNATATLSVVDYLQTKGLLSLEDATVLLA